MSQPPREIAQAVDPFGVGDDWSLKDWQAHAFREAQRDLEEAKGDVQRGRAYEAMGLAAESAAPLVRHPVGRAAADAAGSILGDYGRHLQQTAPARMQSAQEALDFLELFNARPTSE